MMLPEHMRQAAFYGVRTTGIYCRTSCPSKPPRPENVLLFETAAGAAAAGFRACKRCKPDQPGGHMGEIIAAVCRWIDSQEQLPGLAQMAAQAGLSPFHFHRVFRQATGLTPRQYATGRRAERMRASLGAARSVTDAVYEAGYGSNGTFYTEAGGRLGMTPSAFRAGGAGEVIQYATRACSLGSILVARTPRGICTILLGDDREALEADLRRRFPKAEIEPAGVEFEVEVSRVVALVEAPGSGAELPLDIRGTSFQHRVWQALREIPAGSTASYASIAARIGSPSAARAVARACAANQLAVAIPCHRVVRGDGDLGGYRWGSGRKRELLFRERDMSKQ